MISRECGRLQVGTSLVAIVAIMVAPESRSPCGRVRRALAQGREGRLGPGQGESRNDAHARADLHQRAVALAAGRDQGRTAARGELGLLQGPRLLARNHRLHAEGLPDGLRRIRAGRTHGWRGITAAWYEREITVPDRVGRPPHRPVRGVPEFLSPPCTSTARRRARSGFRAAKLDLTPACRPGGKHVLSMLVVAMPLKGVMLSYTDTASAREVKGTVQRRGLCGDVYLVGTPAGPRIADVKVDTSVRKGQITFDAALRGPRRRTAVLPPRPDHAGRPRRDRVHEQGVHRRTTSRTAASRSPRTGSRTSSGISTRRRTCIPLSLSLLDAKGQVLDTACDVRFGFREFWIDGRDFYLNGTPHLPVRRPAGQRPDRRRAGQLRGAPRRAWSGSRASASTSSTPTTTAASRAPI